MKLKLVGNYTYGTTKKFRVFENELGNKYLEKTTSIKNYEILKDKLFFVEKNVPHYFHSNTKELKVLYFFGGPDN